MKKATGKAVALIAAATCASMVGARDLVGNGSWFDAAVWNNGVPGNGTVCWLAPGLEVVYDQAAAGQGDQAIAAMGVGSGTGEGLADGLAPTTTFTMKSGNLTLTDSESTWFDASWHYSFGSNNAVIDLVGGSLTFNDARWATRSNSETTLTIEKEATLIANSWVNIGYKGRGIVNQYGNAEYHSLIEMGCTADSTAYGEYNLYSGTFSVHGAVDVSHYGNQAKRGVFNQFGGEAEFKGYLRVGYAQANGEYNMSGGTAVCRNWVSLGNQAGAYGELNVSGGTFSVVEGGLNVGEGGMGKMTVCDKGVVSTISRVRIGPWNSSVTVKDGGTLIAPSFENGANEGNASHLKVDGGILKLPGENGSYGNYFGDLDDVTVGEKGMILDLGARSMSIDFSKDCFTFNGPVIKRGSGKLVVTGVKPTLNLQVEEGQIEMPFVKPDGAAGLVHRYSFDGDAVDSVTGQAAQGVNNVSFTTGANGSCVYFPAGYNGEHEVYFGSGFLPNGAAGTTVELFFRVRGEVPDLTPMFESSGPGGIGFGCGLRMNEGEPRGFINLGGDNHWSWEWSNEYGRADDPDKTYCYTMCFKDNEAGQATGVMYNQNIADPAEHSSVSRICEDRSLAGLDQQWASLGKSFHEWGGRRTPEFEVYELRVWDKAFTESEAIASALAGPDTLKMPNFLSLQGVTLTVRPETKIEMTGNVDLTGAIISASGDPEALAALVAKDHRIPVITTSGVFTGTPAEGNLKDFGVRCEVKDGVVYLRPRFGLSVNIR